MTKQFSPVHSVLKLNTESWVNVELYGTSSSIGVTRRINSMSFPSFRLSGAVSSTKKSLLVYAGIVNSRNPPPTCEDDAAISPSQPVGSSSSMTTSSGILLSLEILNSILLLSCDENRVYSLFWVIGSLPGCTSSSTLTTIGKSK
ncbi:MAG: hypothetical protein CMB29_00310 [Euryarchaeota archaeon]|nr:hypothetical protein [Euryarchaeota archaeon]